MACAAFSLLTAHASAQTVAPPGAQPAGEPRVLVTDREAIAGASEALDFGQLLFAQPHPGADNATLWNEPAYRAVVDLIVRELEAIAARDPQAGVTIRGHAHRLFDARWLRARSAHFELVGVANRMDRRAFDPAGCGEVRLVYRLGYRQPHGQGELASRLPMTWVVELRAAANADCRAAARRWMLPPTLSGRALGARLVSADSPLARELATRARIVRIGVNVQTVRWPALTRPALGGHAEYLLRNFAWDERAGRYRPLKLENTPDVAGLRRDPARRARLRDWLAQPEHLAEIDRGVAQLPEEFLAESVTSVTPRGLARLANRPFRQLFLPADWTTTNLAELRVASSPEALLRRLDDLSCSGCHQSRSLAGFHLLGEDGAGDAPGSALFTGRSPHLEADLARRRAYVQAIARGEPGDDARPFAERPSDVEGSYGAPCGLGDAGFRAWRCAAGLACAPYAATAGEQTVGVCLPALPRVGDPCEPARVLPDANAQRDRVAPAQTAACEGVCERTRVGFPGGMCASSCDALPSDAACGAIALLTPFNDCLARARPFSACASAHARPAGLRACSADTPCRDDYVCARTASAQGACLPPYFMLQLRVDGHPSPR